MMIHLLLVIVLLVSGSFSRVEFLIKHKTSGKYMKHYYDGRVDYLQITDQLRHAVHFYFEPRYEEWGHIRSIESGKPVQNFHLSYYPKDGAKAILWTGAEDQALFVLDQVNNHIVHVGGSYLHPYRGDLPIPPEDDFIVFHSGLNQNMRFEFVNPNNTDEVVFPYGNANITGDWKLMLCVQKPLAEHTESYTLSIGKSETDSTTSTFKFAWEGSVGIQLLFAMMSSSASLTKQIEYSSSETWHAEITKTDSITVSAGDTVCTWQMHFIGKQSDHTGVHYSNIFADTNSPLTPPDEYEYTKLRYL